MFHTPSTTYKCTTENATSKGKYSVYYYSIIQSSYFSANLLSTYIVNYLLPFMVHCCGMYVTYYIFVFLCIPISKQHIENCAGYSLTTAYMPVSSPGVKFMQHSTALGSKLQSNHTYACKCIVAHVLYGIYFIIHV